jgi:hypothetical protein
MNVPETSSVPVSPTPTPSITATATLTPTPTPTDSRACRTYTILGSCFASTAFSWTNCDGTSGTQTLYCSSQNICAKQGSVSQSGGFGTITDIGTCPLPTPTPTATSTLTPTLTPTNTTTPTPTSSPIESMVLMEDSGSILMEGTGSVLMEIQ